MKTICLILLMLAFCTVAGEYEWINLYTGGPTEGTYIWTWGFAEEPKPVEETGFTPETAAVEVKWGKITDSWNADWTSYGVYFGDIGFDMEDIVPDSIYFKLKAPDGVGEADRLNVWLYDPRNMDWNNALFYELENFQILQDKEWHQFSVCLWDFAVNVDNIDVTNVIAVSLERPAEDEDTTFPLMYIDHVWVGLPDFVSVEESASPILNNFSLRQNYPNPFNPITTIAFELARAQKTKLSIYNLNGECVGELVSGQLPAGFHNFQWNAGNNPTGTYFYKIETEDFVQSRKMMLIR